MELLRRLRGVAAAEPAIIQPTEMTTQEVTVEMSPDAIDILNHPLRFYPGFEEYVSDWNTYVESPARTGFFKNVTTRQKVAELTEQQAVTALEEREGELHERAAKREQEKIIYESNHSKQPKQQRNRELRKATEVFRNAQQRLEETMKLQDALNEQAREKFAEAQVTLEQSDTSFALGGADDDIKVIKDRVFFYALTRLTSQDSVDELFREFSYRSSMKYDFELRGINYHYEVKRARLAGEEEGDQDRWEIASQAVLRQRPDMKRETY